jgi:8-oxo-dGTP diphosphatase
MQLNHPIHVVYAVIEKDGKVLCAQHSEHMALLFKWEFPGGKIEVPYEIY